MLQWNGENMISVDFQYRADTLQQSNVAIGELDSLGFQLENHRTKYCSFQLAMFDYQEGKWGFPGI